MYVTDEQPGRLAGKAKQARKAVAAVESDSDDGAAQASLAAVGNSMMAKLSPDDQER